MNIEIQKDTISAIQQNIDLITKQLAVVIENTDAFKDGFSTFFTYSSLAASIVTVLGISAVFIKISKQSISNRRQKKIILDLLRHLMVNNAILEVICYNLKKTDSMVPLEGTLERFSTLEDDMNLGKFSTRAKNYEKLHNISLLIRNYNSIVCNADKHLHEKDYPEELLDKELNEIFRRSERISGKLLELSKEMHIFPVTVKGFSNYTRTKYFVEEQSLYIEDKRCRYYDNIDLGDVYDCLINDHSKKLLY